MATKEGNMINRIIENALKVPIFVALALLVSLGAGIYQYKTMPVDAFPDISPTMVPVFAEGHGMAPEEIERLITFPIESAMNGLPKVKLIKSTSAFGMAVVYIYFEDEVDIYFARQLVSERLVAATAELPEMDEPPTLGPISTGLGQIFMYYLKADATKVNTEGKPINTWLREVNDWFVKFQLQTVPGVTDVLSMGGHILQYQIHLNPNLLRQYELSIGEVVEAVTRNNQNAGGQFLVLGSEEHLVRGIGLIQSLDDIKHIAVKEIDGNPIYLKDISEVNFGNEIRRGVVSRNGTEEVVAGIIMKLYGENTSKVIKNLYSKVAEVQRALPEGVELIPYYEQAELVENATNTVKNALWQGGLLVIIVLLLFLGTWRATFIVLIALPFSSLIAVMMMRYNGISANLMSLAGIAVAIGMLCDGAIVMIESILLHLGRSSNKSKKMKIIQAAQEVGNPILFSGLIVLLVFVPLFMLEGVEGKMFRPMAFSVSSAMFGSILYSLLVIPTFAIFLLKNKKLKETWIVEKLKLMYAPLLKLALKGKKIVILFVFVLFGFTCFLITQLGTEFIPVLEEGSIQVGIAMSPSTSLEQGTEIVMELERKMLEFDEVQEVVSRIGRPEAGSHPHPVNFAEAYLSLKPRNQWESFKTKSELVDALRQKTSVFPGVQFNFSQPIQNLFDEMLSGVKTQLAIKLYGDDLTTLRQKSEEIKEVISGIEGLVDLSTEQSFGQPQIQVIADREECARYGVTVNDILQMVELAVGGEVIDDIYLNTRRFGIQIRYQEQFRNEPEELKQLLLTSRKNQVIPLGQVAEVRQVIGPIQINREKNQRRWIVQGNVRDRDIGSVVADIQNEIKNKVIIPEGYILEYGGQFENQQRAMTRLSIIIPIVIAFVFLLLWASFGKLRHALIIFTMVPLSVIGGVFGLFLMQQYLSVPASVGFIALFGMAMLDGMVLVSYINNLRKEGRNLEEAIFEGSMLRLGPVAVTTVTTLLGLIPLLLASGIGSEVQRPLASVVIFGLATSTILTLLVIPVVYSLVESRVPIKAK